MIRWTPLIAAGLLALLSACSSTPAPQSTAQLGVMAKGGGTTTDNSLSVVLLGADGAARMADLGSTPKIGDQITFEVKTRVAEPWVRVTCYVGGIAYYTKIHGFFQGYEGGQTFTLGPTSIWTHQSANCSAQLLTFSRGKTGVLANTNFEVMGQ